MAANQVKKNSIAASVSKVTLTDTNDGSNKKRKYDQFRIESGQIYLDVLATRDNLEILDRGVLEAN